MTVSGEFGGSEVSDRPSGALWRVEGGDFIFEAPGVARFSVSGGYVSVDRVPGCPQRKVSQLTGATPRAAAHFQRGHLALHAAAVVPPSATPAGATLVCGVSWAGKSTVAAALAERGWQVLEDDLVPVAHGLSGVPVLAERPEVPVLCAVVLRLSGGTSPSLSRATGAEVFDLLTRSVYQSHVADALLEPSAFGRLISALATNVQVWQLDRPRGVECIEDVADLVARVISLGDDTGGAGVDLTCDDA